MADVQVCLGDYEPGEECRVLKCRHAYHRECVDEWLSKGRNSCPACRSEGEWGRVIRLRLKVFRC
jgi:hypothetical protein